MRLALLLAVLLAALSAEATDPDLVWIGNPGNPPDVDANCLETGCGSVAAGYAIGRTEVTNLEYADFLNAVARFDSNELYHPSMDADARGGIVRSGSPGHYSYSVKPGHEAKPVVFVSLWDAMRYANWLHNGQPSGKQTQATTENGAYAMMPSAVAANSVTRRPGAEFFVPSEHEWYKAAYYDAGLGDYYNSPTSSDLAPVTGPPPGAANTANVYGSGGYAVTLSTFFDNGVDYLTDVGAYALSPSPYGTFDQGGNVWEWNETVPPATPSQRGLRGGGWDDQQSYVSKSIPSSADPTDETYDYGFRVASAVPEPGAVLLAATGALVLAAAGRRRA